MDFVFSPVATHAVYRSCTTRPTEAKAYMNHYLDKGVMTPEQAVNLLLLSSVDELNQYRDGTKPIPAEMARRFLGAVNDIAYREQKKVFLASQKAITVESEPVKKDAAPRSILESKFLGLVKARVGRYGIMSAAALAAALKGSERNVHHWRAGKHFPDIKTMKRVIDLLQKAA